MSAPARPNVFAIPAGIPFARSLAEGLVQQSAGADALALSDMLVFVPTRRAVRHLKDAFASALGGAALLPDIRTLGDAEDDPFDPPTDDMASLPAIAPLRRRLLLATLVERWQTSRNGSAPFVQAVSYAGELARFLDEAITQGADLKALKTLAPESFAGHWQEVLRFLDIVAEQWPGVLEAEGKAEASVLRDARLKALAQSLTRRAPTGRVVAAGSTGSIPATAALLKTIASLPNGCVVLPALDRDLDEDSWESLDASHAQFGLRQLLASIGIGREDVAPWPQIHESYPQRIRRVRFLAEALRPPPTTDAWRDLVEGAREQLSSVLNGLSRIEAANRREEALVIACALREALETPGRTAALVTPDRGLARRVAADLTRWDIAIDDSGGRPLSHTPPGAFLALLAEAAADEFSPVSLLALLKHPLACGRESRADFLRQARRLEILALRGVMPAKGLAAIAARLEGNEHAPETLRHWFARLCGILAPLADAMRAQNAPLETLALAHSSAAENLASDGETPGAGLLWRGQAGEAAAEFLGELTREGAGIALQRGNWYAELFRALAAERTIRPRFNRHPRVAILGPLEARLLDFDLTILGGLNEGVWPAEAASDPFLSRPMRKALGLEAPERRTGLSAHDFATLAANPTVLLTRSLKEAGAPAMPSRWLLRMTQLATGLGLAPSLAARDDILLWAREIDKRPREKRAQRPAPRPPVSTRPRQLSVTEIETWLRDPYAIYAKHILRLRPLDPLNAEAGARERGIAVHRVLEKFLRRYPDSLPTGALAELLRLGEETLVGSRASPALLALWRPRLQRALAWFFEFEWERRDGIASTAIEAKGEFRIAPSQDFTLRGRADRIDIYKDGSAAILDYKTGRVPSDKQIEELLAPQLPLEAAMLLAGAFEGVHASSVRELIHVRLTGGLEEGELHIAKAEANAIAKEARERLARHAARYESPGQPYLSRAAAERIADEGDYDHLARVAEWSLAEDGE